MTAQDYLISQGFKQPSERLCHMLNEFARMNNKVVEKVVYLDSPEEETPKESVPVSLNRILTIVCNEFDISYEQLKGPSRKRNIADARHVFFYLARNHTKKSLSKIGDYANRDHATVLHGTRCIENIIAVDTSFRLMIDRIENNI